MFGRARLNATVYGRVQGVFFRAFVYDYALDNSITGYARNLPGGRAVEVRAEGEAVALRRLLEALKEGPPAARVDRVEADWGAPTGEFETFEVR